MDPHDLAFGFSVFFMVNVNCIPFLVTIPKVIRLGSETELPNINVVLVVSALLVFIDTYLVRGFKILSIVADYAFEDIWYNVDFGIS